MTTPTLSSLFVTNTEVGVAQQIWNGGSGVQPFIFNNDEVNTLYIGAQQDVLAGFESSCIPVPPLGGQSWPDVDIWAFAPTPVNMLIVPGATSWAPSPVQVQIALEAAGLATSELQTVQNTSINDPGYGPSTYDRQVLQETNIPSNIQYYGTPPYIPGSKSVAMSLATAADSPYTLLTVPAGGIRIWSVQLSMSVATDGAYSGGLNDAYARVYSASAGEIYANVNCAFGAAGQTAEDQSTLAIGGIVVGAGDTIILDVNNGVNVTDAFIRCAITITYSPGTGSSGGPVGVPNYLTPSGDVTGITDTIAIQNALTAGNAWLGPGEWYVTNLTMPWNSYLQGFGPLTQINAVGSGDVIVMSNPTTPSGDYGGYPVQSGTIRDLCIDGTNTTGKSTGLHIGNGLGFTVDNLFVRNFTDTSDSIGIWVDDSLWWTEKCYFRVQVAQCSICYQFSNENPAHGSFEYSTYDMVAYWDTGQTAFNLINNGSSQIFYGGGKYYWRGNCHDTSGAPGPFLAFTGDILFKRCEVIFCPESNAPAGEAQTILDNGGAAGARFQNCHGWMDFGANVWAATNMTEAVDLTGSIEGDATLQALRGPITKPTVTTPAVAPSTTFTNDNGVGVNAIVSGGTGVSIILNGNATGLSSGIFPIPMGQTINLGAYSVAPTVWHWIPAAYP